MTLSPGFFELDIAPRKNLEPFIHRLLQPSVSTLYVTTIGIIKEKHRECKCFFEFFSIFSLISDKKTYPLFHKSYTNRTIDIVYSGQNKGFPTLTQNKYCEFRSFVSCRRTQCYLPQSTIGSVSVFCIQHFVLSTIILPCQSQKYPFPQ